MTIDIDRDAAQDAARSELAKTIYPKPSPIDMLYDWIEKLLYRLASGASDFPGGWYTVAVLLILLAVAIVVAVRVARRAMRSSRLDSPALFGDHLLSAAQHRASAETYAAEGSWAPAIRHRLRAVARQLEENGTLVPAPGRTATELARTAGATLPGIGNEFFTAAEVFNDVTYGEQPGSESQYRMIAALDDRLGAQAPSAYAGAGSDAVAQPWAEIR